MQSHGICWSFFVHFVFAQGQAAKLSKRILNSCQACPHADAPDPEELLNSTQEIAYHHLSLITRYWSDWTGAISCSFERLMRRVSLHSLWQEGQSSEEEVPSDSSGSRLNKWERIGEGREARCGLVSYLFPAFGSWSPAEAKLLWLNFKSPFFVILYISWASTRNDWLECTVPLPWGSFHPCFYCRASVDSTGSQDAAAKALRVAWKEWRGNGGGSHARHAHTL